MKILAIFMVSLGFMFPVMAQAFDMGLSGGDMMGGLAIATAVQKAVESGNYVFVAVVVLMLGLQALKIIYSSKSSSLRRNAAQYSAMGGATMGVAGAMMTGGDPAQGAVGGLLVGNAASGLYSTLKPVGELGKKYLRSR